MPLNFICDAQFVLFLCVGMSTVEICKITEIIELINYLKDLVYSV